MIRRVGLLVGRQRIDISSLGDAHFSWAVERMAELVVQLATAPPPAAPNRWDELLGR